MANQPKVFQGKTEDAEAPFLDAAFWFPDTKITASVERSWMSSNGECYVLNLAAPVKLNKVDESRVSIGNLTGFRMAMDAAGLKKLLVGDFIEVECTGIISPKKAGQSPRPNFAIKVTRPVLSDGPGSPDSDDPFYK